MAGQGSNTTVRMNESIHPPRLPYTFPRERTCEDFLYRDSGCPSLVLSLSKDGRLCSWFDKLTTSEWPLGGLATQGRVGRLIR